MDPMYLPLCLVMPAKKAIVSCPLPKEHVAGQPRASPSVADVASSHVPGEAVEGRSTSTTAEVPALHVFNHTANVRVQPL